MAEIKISWYPARSCWRKSITVDGEEKVKYYQYPNNPKGKEAAIAAYLKDKAALTGMTFEQKVRQYLPLVLDWYDKNPPHEGWIILHLRKMVKTLELPHENFKSAPTSVSGVYDYPYPLNLFAVNWGLQSWELPEVFRFLLTKKPINKNDGSIACDLSVAAAIDVHQLSQAPVKNQPEECSAEHRLTCQFHSKGLFHGPWQGTKRSEIPTSAHALRL